MKKLSELCNNHLVRLNYDFSNWKDSITIQRGNRTLIYFESKYYRSKTKVTTVIWVDKKGKIEMIDGRFSIKGDVFNREIMDIILQDGALDMDYDACRKLPNTKFTEG